MRETLRVDRPGHIFRILADPGVRRLKVEPKKRSVHVFLPRASSSSGFERPQGDGENRKAPQLTNGML
eukprot:Skav210802  [mRNA]  locus=scaffold275:297339:300586:+ [translate_table: standard]